MKPSREVRIYALMTEFNITREQAERFDDQVTKDEDRPEHRIWRDAT